MVAVGLWLDFAAGRNTLRSQLDSHVHLVEEAERQGFDSVWVGESYSGAMPAPFQALAALSRHTSVLLGTGVVLAPAWHPLRLAYEVAALDQLTGGRVLVGVGLGSPHLQRRYGVSPESVGQLVDETLALLRAAWQGAPQFEGTHVRMDSPLHLLPVQSGGPPLLVGGSVRRSALRAAALGDGYYASTNHSLGQVQRQIGHYRTALAGRGGPRRPGAAVVNRLAVVRESADEAHATARRQLGPVLQQYARIGSLGTVWRTRQATPAALFDALDQEWCLVGNPEQVATRVRRYSQAGVTRLNLRVVPGDTPAEIGLETIRLMGQEVLPRVAATHDTLVPREGAP